MMIKSLTAREIFNRCPQVKKKLWGGEYQKLHEDHQLTLF